MLVMFRVKNFSSFVDEVVLDMRATTYREHPSHVIKTNHLNLLKTLAIYGANASGKSNLMSALYWFEKFIFNQIYQEKGGPVSNNQNEEVKSISSIQPFLLRDPIDVCTEFEMIFIHQEVLFQYGFSFERTNILSEWLHVDNDLVFERDPTGISFGTKYKAQLKSLNKYRSDRLYLSVLDYFAMDDVKVLVDLFKDFFANRFNVHFELIMEFSVKGTMLPFSRPSYRLLEDDIFREKVIEYLKRIDVGIEDLIVEKETKTRLTGETKESIVLKTFHPIYDKSQNRIGSKEFDLSQESSGTLRFLSFIQEILILLESGGVFVIDELSARLHPLLTKFIVDLFQSSENNNHAQLIFTTHDTSLLNKEQFRRDEISFVDKSERGESTLYSLADLKSIRQDATYNKDYFTGKYGAIPIIKTLFKKNGDG